MLTKPDTKHIGILDGVRVIAILFVVWFHFWQQTWIDPVLNGPIRLDFNTFVRTGYLFVDMMILISGFCLFLPYARSMIEGEAWPDTKTFYKKRFFRIYPSFAFVILVCFFAFCHPLLGYESGFAMLKDLLSALTFTSIHFSKQGPIMAVCGVTWTVMVEVHYYIVFPFLARAFRKLPWLTYLGMTAIGLGACLYLKQSSDMANLYVNQVLTFACVYANGMLGAYLYILYCKKFKHTTGKAVLCTAISIGAMIAYFKVATDIMTYDPVSVGQLTWRLPLSFLFLIFILASALSIKYYQYIFSNPITRFIALISYNLYLWHQLLAVQIKEHHIPFWTGDVPPNQLGDTDWMWKYHWIILLAAFAMATLTTFLIERPIARHFGKR